jgi:hypothetical protein
VEGKIWITSLPQRLWQAKEVCSKHQACLNEG